MGNDIIILGSICSAILAMFSLLAGMFLMVRKGRKMVKKMLRDWTGFDEISNKLDTHFAQANDRDVSIKALQRSSLYCVKKELREICEKVMKRKSLTFNEQEIIAEGKEVYTLLHGNGIMYEKIEKALSQPIKEAGGK
jgi:hypothetical protein